MQLLQKEGVVKVDELADKFQVSPLTIRRDLEHWEEKGALERFYGGARLIQGFVYNDENDITSSNERYKHAIAKYAVQYVEDGDSIFINTSTTALLVLKYIRNKRVTVITNNGKAILMDYDPLISIFLTGGELRTPKESMVGDIAIYNLGKLNANKCFLGCSGISVDSDMTTAILQEVIINELMISRCNGSTFILADHTKVRNTHNFISGDIDAFDYVITDDTADEEECERMKERGVQVVKLSPLAKIE